MFKILLILDDKESISLGLKYLLYRYELVFKDRNKDIDELLETDNIDLILFNLNYRNGSSSYWGLLEKWGKRKKVIVIVDDFTSEVFEGAYNLGALACIDKLDIQKIPYLVEKYLNKSKTRVINRT